MGLEDALATEMRKLGITNIKTHTRAVSGEGELYHIYRLNMALQTGIRVMVPVSDFPLRNPDNLYYAALDIPWEEYFDPDQTFAVYANGRHPMINHTGFAGLKIKDGIVDRFRRKFKKRPDVNTENPDIRIELQFNNKNGRIMVDSSGDSLHKRGYKEEHGEAPLSEVLAAGLLHMLGWNDNMALLDPMCGSGTFSTEAGLKATRSLAQFHRSEFACRNWKNYTKKMWQDERNHGMRLRKEPRYPIYTSDKDGGSVAIARINAKKAGVFDNLTFRLIDFFDMLPPEKRGYIILNPPYGERLHLNDIPKFYKDLSLKLQKDFKGWRVGLLSGSQEGLKAFGMRPDRSYDVMNGDIASKFEVFDLK